MHKTKLASHCRYQSCIQYTWTIQRLKAQKTTQLGAKLTSFTCFVKEKQIVSLSHNTKNITTILTEGMLFFIT